MRKAKPKKRQLLPDPKYNDVLVTRFVNNLMKEGKKQKAYNIFYQACELVEAKLGKDGEPVSGIDVWKQALNNIMPTVEVRSRRVGGATFQVPSEVRPDRKISLGIKWMVKYARLRNEKTMTERLAGEIIAASKKEGAAVKKKDDTHRMADANKAFSHFRF